MVELILTIVTGALLALIAGNMLVFFYLGWTQDHEAVDLQRDGTVAVEFLARSLRAASPGGITVLPQQIDVTGPTATERIFVSGNNLAYDPDIDTPGGEVALVKDHLAAFNATQDLGSVSYRITLDNGTDRSTIEGTFTQRN